VETRPFQAHIPPMNLASGIVIASVILALTGAILFRWELQTLPNPGVFRLDRWTGQVSTCALIPNSRKMNCE
jgi:hypothetical protein